MLLSDITIATLCAAQEPMIQPFCNRQVRRIEGYPLVSFGLSTAGYDIRLSNEEFKIFSPIGAQIIDPKKFDENTLVAAPSPVGDHWIMPPHSYALGISVEEFQMPDDVVGLCLGKSTYARCGLIVNATPLEPGWRGRLVLEFSNSASLPVKIYAREGVAQVLFFRADQQPMTTYADRNGKYQGQDQITYARV